MSRIETFSLSKSYNIYEEKICNDLIILIIVLLLFIVVNLICPTWTPVVKEDNSISELRKVNVGGTELEIMIRGTFY